jgi:molecular chaperone GrpE
LSDDAIDRVLTDFRAWLVELAAVPTPAEAPAAVDLHTLVSQFTALRHEINLQTKAARTSIEQSGEVLTELRGAVEELRDRPVEDDELTPLLKAIVDVYDNLALALRQVTKQREAIELPLTDLVDGTILPEPLAKEIANLRPAKAPSLWSRLFSAPAMRSAELDALFELVKARRGRTEETAKLVRSSFDGLIAGYSMSLARVDRVLEQFNLEPIATIGETFDPELMEVVEVVGDSGKPAGEVLEEVRRGYWRGEIVFRFAQVKVAR